MKETKIEARLSALRAIENAAVLLRLLDDGQCETIFVTVEFAKLMECTVDEAMTLMNGSGFIKSTHPDDRLSVRRMLRRQESEQHTKELTIRKTTAQGNEIWCNVHYAFINESADQYVYCTYFDVTTSRIYAQRLRASYMTIGDTFYRENNKTLGMFRVNLAKDRIEGMKGKDLFGTDSTIRPYSEVMKLRAVNYPIKREQEKFIEMFGREKLMAAYLEGKIQQSIYLFSRRKDGRQCYVKFAVMLTRHPV